MKLKGYLYTLTEITGVFIEYWKLGMEFNENWELSNQNFMEINYLQKGISVENLKYLYRLKGFCSTVYLN